MGTVIIFKNIKFVIRSKDHNPAHVHAISPDGEAKIELETINCFYSRGYSKRDVNRICKVVEEHKEFLMEVWNEYHS